MNFAQEAWLLVASGGWWRTQEILRRVPLEVDLVNPHSHLYRMVHREHVLSARGAYKKREYAVTLDCKVPAGLTLKQVLAAVQGEP